ncbi:hypothetical protein FAZ95_38770 [Trinickia violacea]|uniref:Uncharacterized protein n=1 Tax=Trinickia violacea TaxID=2571746 RepID=A0A4P8J3I4_9BURK|nr:hypothetical protein [Trinickia violacea]QCP55085.1 hypothetical protein FAZ95_38770 [Trinickia violacea]
MKKLIKRAITAYAVGIGMVVFAAAISLSHGAGLKPLLILLPLFLFVFGGITYQLIKELRALNREKPRDPE